MGFAAALVSSPIFTEFMVSLQDVDCLYLTKEELEVRVGLLRQQLEFLKCIYAEVRAPGSLSAALGMMLHLLTPPQLLHQNQGKVTLLKILQWHPQISLSLCVFPSTLLHTLWESKGCSGLSPIACCKGRGLWHEKAPQILITGNL